METISVKKIWKSIWKHKAIVVVFALIGLLAGAGLGVKKVKSVSSSSEVKKIEDYKSGLEKYKEVMTNIETNIATTQEQIDKLQTYCDSSIYMKIDSLNVNVATVQYRITMGNSDNSQIASSGISEKLADITNELTSYVKNGDWKDAVSKELPDVPVEYVSEIVSSSTTGNIFTLSVIHYDAEQAEKICKVIDEQIKDYASTTLKENGDFSFSVIMDTESTMALPEVQSNQNSYLTSLKNYTDSLSDLQKKQLSQQISEKTYIKDYQPDSMNAPSSKKVLIEYAAVGVIAGLVIIFAVFAFIYVISDKLKGKENIKAAGIPVLGNYSVKQGYQPSLEREMVDLELMVKSNHKGKLFLGMLSEDDPIKQAVQEYETALEKLTLDTEHGYDIINDAETLKHLIAAGNCILFAEVGKTTYTEIKAYLEICKKFNVSVLGCVVVE